VPDLRRRHRARVRQTARGPARRKTRWNTVTGAQRLKGPATGSGPACWRHAGLRGDIEEAGYGARRLSCHRPLRRSRLGPGGGLGVTARVDPEGRGCIAAFACHGPEGILLLIGLGAVWDGEVQASTCAVRRGTRRRASEIQGRKGRSACVDARLRLRAARALRVALDIWSAGRLEQIVKSAQAKAAPEGAAESQDFVLPSSAAMRSS
jgi:hypothetical protein